MQSFSDLITPASADVFFAEHYGRRPLHASDAGSARRGLMPWAEFNRLMSVQGFWTERLLKLVRGGEPIDPGHYCDPVPGLDGLRRLADPAKVKVFTDMGATMIANEVHALSPEVQRVAALFGEPLQAQVQVNAYCSFQAHQGFGPHFDISDVFAIQTEGEKTWRIYEARADNPTEVPQGPEESIRAWLDRTKGRLLHEVRMRPGDLLYLPRGWYHDALASSSASLHLTFSVAPHTAKALFRLLEQEAMRDRAFRAYLPTEEAALSSHLAGLSERLGVLMRSPALVAELRHAQRSITPKVRGYDLPSRSEPEMYRRTSRGAEVARRGEAWVVTLEGGDLVLEDVHEAAGWLLGRPAFALQELLARFPHRSEPRLRGLVAHLTRAGVLVQM